MTKPIDPLTQLLRHALHHQRVQQTQIITGTKSKTQIATSAISQDPVYRDLYQNPLNWTRGRRVALIHKDGPHETFLGVFQELLNTRARVRRLVRDHSPQAHGHALPRELVHGPYWLRPQVFTPPEDSPQEVQALRERLDELLRSIA